MYEKKPVTEIQKKILDGISNIYEKAKGYFLWELTKGVAIAIKDTSDKVADDAAKLDVYNLTGEDLENYTYKNEGITRKKAASAMGYVLVKGKGIVSKGNVFETEGLVRFIAIDTVPVDGETRVDVIAEQPGLNGNVPAETVINIPITISGISECNNPEPMTGGYDAESDEELLNRYFRCICCAIMEWAEYR